MSAKLWVTKTQKDRKMTSFIAFLMLTPTPVCKYLSTSVTSGLVRVKPEITREDEIKADLLQNV
tara:strand:- start:1747 stop:1938 length:192 start_codon:yes stop_codon:yes gene_type:complete